MPAEDWPSFHWRPSTASTLRPFSFSMRQMPTTLTSAVGSAPTVSLAKSSFSVSAAAATAASPIAATVAADAHDRDLLNRMALLLGGSCDEDRINARRPARPEPGQRDRERQRGEEPGERRGGVGDQRMARVVVARSCRRRRHAGEAVDQRQDLARAGRAADVAPRAVGVLDLAVALVP